MTDSEFTMFVFLWIFGAVILLQTWRIHRYRKKIEDIALAGPAKAALAPSVQEAPAVARNDDVEALRKRVQVLERIATDGSPSLEREIEGLRTAG